MKLEFLNNGSPDCPLIRLYDFDAEQARRLQQIALRLTKDQSEAVALHAESDIHAINGCELTLRQADKDHGVNEVAESQFECALTKGAWLDVGGLIQPFCRGESSGHQWLTRISKIALLLSRDGQW